MQEDKSALPRSSFMEQKKKELREQRQKEMKDYFRQVASTRVKHEDRF